MKGTRSALLCLTVALAVGALAAPVASAAEYGPKEFPEIGRCVKLAFGQGTYKGANCMAVAAPGHGVYEWIPATASEKLTFVTGGGETTIKTVGHSTIKCINGNITGEWLNEKQASVVLQLPGCEDQAHNVCQGVGSQTKALISSGSLTAELGFIKLTEKVAVVGLDLKPPFLQDALFTYECGGGPLEQNAIEGSLIGKWKPIQKNSEELRMLFRVTKSGKQIPENFQEKEKDTLFTTYRNNFETVGSGASTLNIVGELFGSQSTKLEVRTREFPFTG